MDTSDPIQLSCRGVYPALSVVSMSTYRDWQHQRTMFCRERKPLASTPKVQTPNPFHIVNDQRNLKYEMANLAHYMKTNNGEVTEKDNLENELRKTDILK